MKSRKTIHWLVDMNIELFIVTWSLPVSAVKVHCLLSYILSVGSSSLDESDLVSKLMQFNIIHYQGHHMKEKKRCSKVIDTEELINCIEKVSFRIIV